MLPDVGVAVIHHGLLFDFGPILVRAADFFGRVFLPEGEALFVVDQIELAVDDGPRLGVDGVLVAFFDGDTERAIPVILWGIAVWLFRKQVEA